MLIAPLMPGVNDAPEQVEAIVDAATEAKATYIGGQTLFLRGAVRDDLLRLAARAPPGSRAALREALCQGRLRLGQADKRRIELDAGAPLGAADLPDPRPPPGAAARRSEPLPRMPRVTQGSLLNAA